MRKLRAFVLRLVGLVRRQRAEDEFAAELESHVALHTDAGVRAGLAPQDARRQALIYLGGVEQARQAQRERSSFPLLENLVQDSLYALRTLRRSPGFATTAILTLALGIGATTAVFTLVYSIILQPLPYQNPGRLVTIWEEVKYLQLDRLYVEVNARHQEYWQQRATDFSDITLLREGTAGIGQVNEHPRIVGVVMGYANLFSVLGVQPELGRTFLPQEGTSGHDHVAIITHDLWQQSFSGDPKILGKTLRLNGNLLQIVGVLPQRFHFPKGNVLSSQPTEAGTWPAIGVFVPLIVGMNQRSLGGDFDFIALGRLKNGVSLQQATAELNTIDGAILNDYAREAKTTVEPDMLRVHLQPMQETVVTSINIMLWLLLGAVIAVLLIACVNLANLQLARAIRREKELSVRTALGATAYRLVSAALCESLLLSVVGGAAGIVLAQILLRIFLHNVPVDLPRLDEVRMNVWVLGFAIATSVLTGIAFGILPALKSLRVDPQAALQQNGNRTAGEHGAIRTRTWLIGIEVFAATALLMVMGLLDQSLLHLLNESRGFHTDHVFSVEVDVDGHRYGKDDDRALFDDEILSRLRQLPGVRSAGLVSAMPLDGESWLDGLRRPDMTESDAKIANYRWISPDYLSTMGVPLLSGRMLADADRKRNNALISEHTAKELWPDQDPVGRQLARGGQGNYTIVGVVRDTRSNSLKQAPGLMVYLPYWDNPPYTTFFMVRTAQDASSIEAAMRRQIWNHDPDANISYVRSLDEQVNRSLAPERSQVAVLSAFGASALLLAVLGIYGVLSYSVERRVKELGVRIALGASRQNIYVLTIGEAAKPVLFGLAGGMLVSVVAGYAIRSLLYGTAPLSLPVTLLVGTVFLVVSVLAAWLPARRAAAVDPMQALRMD
jgi:putative ABC transport system permease protein